jgi:hypothetical protein
VTNAKITVYIALRWGKNRMVWAHGADVFKNTLLQIMDLTKGGHMCNEPGDKGYSLNTAKGLLDWRGRLTASVIMPTVYSRDKWAKRRLSLQELGHKADIPGDKVEGMGAGSLQATVQGPVPGKLLALIAGRLRQTAGFEDKERLTAKRGGMELEREDLKRMRPEGAGDWEQEGEVAWERIESQGSKR